MTASLCGTKGFDLNTNFSCYKTDMFHVVELRSCDKQNTRQMPIFINLTVHHINSISYLRCTRLHLFRFHKLAGWGHPAATRLTGQAAEASDWPKSTTRPSGR